MVAGIVVHDLGKIDEMVVGPMGLATEYSVDGQLIGHITRGVVAIAKAADKIDCDPAIAQVLEHMVLSHHEVPEFGSPKPPLTPEAEMLQTLDRLDARMYDHFHALAGVEPGEFSGQVFSMGRRKLYAPPEFEA